MRQRSLLLVLVLVLLSSGCTDAVRTVARIHGYTGDIYANPCTPDSLKVGQCVTTPSGGK